MPQERSARTRPFVRLSLFVALACVCASTSGCLIAGYSSSGESFVWPGGLGLVLVLGILLWYFLRKP